MRAVIIGHRGVGKSSLLKRWKVYQPELSFFDLDTEIEKSFGKIDNIFSQKGEAHFRKIEEETLLKILKENSVVALGAGFPLEKIPSGTHILLVRRDSDSKGRIFLDRPRLNSELSSLEEYKLRFLDREPRFSKVAHQVYTMPEGLDFSDEHEMQILNQTAQLKCLITLPTYSKFNGCTYEMRDDIPTASESESLLYSVRINHDIPHTILDRKISIDWDLSRKIPSHVNIQILSTHESSLERALLQLKSFEDSDYQLKLCPMIQTWNELLKGYQWQQRNPEYRSFLPRSNNGRWAWFRLFMKGKQKINFVREAQGSSLDQPTIWEWLSELDRKATFGAVLGSPVEHSFSPTYHKNFFRKKNMGFYRIQIEKTDWNEAFQVLNELGLKAACVTSPLKAEAGRVVGKGPLNTLMKSFGEWRSANTDEVGARALLESYDQNQVLVWGGGGVLPVLQKVVPKASFYSSQKAMPRENSTAIENPQVVVWAAPTGSLSDLPKSWKPKTIVDLSYTQNSDALKAAQSLGCEYVSGLKMFEVQAKAQQEIWNAL